MDLGNYERTMDLHLGRDNNITTGKIYNTVIDKERRGEYLGKTVQMIPHVTDEVFHPSHQSFLGVNQGNYPCRKVVAVLYR